MLNLNYYKLFSSWVMITSPNLGLLYIFVYFLDVCKFSLACL